MVALLLQHPTKSRRHCRSRCNQDNCCTIVATSCSVAECPAATKTMVATLLQHPSHLHRCWMSHCNQDKLHYCCKITLIVAQLLLQHPAQFLNVTLQPRQWLQHCCNIHLIFSVAECPTTTKSMVALLLQHSRLELPTLYVLLQPRQLLHWCCNIPLIVAELLLQHPAQLLNVTLQPRQWLQHCCNIHLIFTVAEYPTATKTMVALLLQHSRLESPTLYVLLQLRQLLHCCCDIPLIVAKLLLQHPAQLLNVTLQPRQWLQHCCNIHLIFTVAEYPTETKATVATSCS